MDLFCQSDARGSEGTSADLPHSPSKQRIRGLDRGVVLRDGGRPNRARDGHARDAVPTSPRRTPAGPCATSASSATPRSPPRHPQRRPHARRRAVRPGHRRRGLPAHLQLREFANVEAKVEPTATAASSSCSSSPSSGRSTASASAATAIDTRRDAQDVVDVHVGEAIDRFRIALARQAIEELYRDKNYPFAHVDVDPEPLAEQRRAGLQHRRRAQRPHAQGRLRRQQLVHGRPAQAARSRRKTGSGSSAPARSTPSRSTTTSPRSGGSTRARASSTSASAAS